MVTKGPMELRDLKARRAKPETKAHREIPEQMEYKVLRVLQEPIPKVRA